MSLVEGLESAQQLMTQASTPQPGTDMETHPSARAAVVEKFFLLLNLF